MKTSCLALALIVFSTTALRGQLAPTTAAMADPLISPRPPTYLIAERGPHHRVWQKISVITNAPGQILRQTNQAYVELATGLNHWRNGAWVASSDQIEILPDGDAAATHSPHQAYFPSDIYTGVIQLVTPDGKSLVSRPLGLAYFDGNQSVLIAELTNSVGGILPSGNQVIYPNAFGFADLRYTFTRAGFEQDIILRERPPDPEQFGLDPATTRLQVLTEFFNPPRPAVSDGTLQVRGIPLLNESLDFGAMKIGSGQAFALNAERPVPGAAIAKQWAVLEGRQFLVEETPMAALADQLQLLPAPGTHASLMLKSERAARKLILPAQRQAMNAVGRPMQRASLSANAGLVLDYSMLNTSQNNYTFQSDTTYYLSGSISLNGTNNTFEGGAVLKYASNVTMTVNTRVTWLGTDYRPIVMVSKNDNSVGETISGSSGSPGTNYSAATALYYDATTANTKLVLQNLRVANAQRAVAINGGGGHVLSQVQAVNCAGGLALTNAEVCLRNALFDHVLTNFTGSSSTGRVEHLTSDTANWLNNDIGANLFLTNCLLVAVTSNGNYSVFQNVNTAPSGGGVFTVVGAGYHYLADGSTNRNAGTTSINPDLLTQLGKLTTYPPIIYSNVTISADTTLTPQAQRDTDMPDIGYHYAPLDYAVDGLIVSNATLALTGGVTLGCFGASVFKTCNGATISSLGNPTMLNRLALYSLVQEQPLLWDSATTRFFDASSAPSPAPTLRLRFTDFSLLMNPAGSTCQFFISPSSPLGELSLQDCWLRGVYLSLSQQNSFNTLVAWTNNLIERGNLSLARDGAYYLSTTVYLWNNLFYKGSLTLTYNINPYSAGTYPDWLVYDNQFLGVTLTESGNAQSNILNGYNGYLRFDPRLASGVSNVLVNSFGFATGPLGRWYQQSTNFSNRGSRTSDIAGLFHYTVTTNLVAGLETKETNSVVDIGFHYVATDSVGNLPDTDKDGMPDYLEDASGNGGVDSGETDWQSAADWGLNVIITQPRNGSSIP